MKIQTAAQVKQLEYMKPMLYHWAMHPDDRALRGIAAPVREAARRRAAPHIKTYIRFSDQSMTKIDWAMVTSANLSTQAWGAAQSATGEVRICSWEVGVLVWPDLLHDGPPGTAAMVPCFQKDAPDLATARGVSNDPERPKETSASGDIQTVVGFRMPYDLPVVPYGKDDVPWCASATHAEPDSMGRVYGGYEGR